jgi:hypothetical protein
MIIVLDDKLKNDLSFLAEVDVEGASKQRKTLTPCFPHTEICSFFRFFFFFFFAFLLQLSPNSVKSHSISFETLLNPQKYLLVLRVRTHEGSLFVLFIQASISFNHEM